jgi:hypothetical protein
MHQTADVFAATATRSRATAQKPGWLPQGADSILGGLSKLSSASVHAWFNQSKSSRFAALETVVL